ncbi:MAG: NAD(P)/FAD-dependent oxidoreductase [Gammaproteobacteria bacterium]|nr:NAD(P)/FAD-dependent oxidoreductase [Gammaproteobacteria bacterium]MCW8924560.1 NAD(P)/FAD-dependent oxidoreductase [Gammaproteobacteria bacterium]
MNNYSRRKFIKLMAGTGALLSASSLLTSCRKTASARVVIVGGGFGGSTCAKYLRSFDGTLDITLIDSAKRFVTCPFSNMVISGMQTMDSISYGYSAQTDRGVKVVHARVQDVDAVAKKLTLEDGRVLGYDRLVLSPGIDFKWDEIEGMQVSDAELIPHAWQGGAQTTLLRRQLTAMRNGGVVIVAPPDNPFRCPPGPYERVSLIAHYLKQHKPRSKILVLDAKDKFSKQALFMQGWKELYPGMVEWVAGSNGGRIDEIDVAARSLYAAFGDAHMADVVNFIPPQKAGVIAHRSGLTNNDGWCDVDQRTFESKIHKDVYVIGDASVAGAMPKSGFAANSQGKVCAAAIVSSLRGVAMPDPSYVNTCYSLVSPDYGISVAAVYRHSKEKGIYKTGGGVSPLDADAAYRLREARYARGWYDSITMDTFG